MELKATTSPRILLAEATHQEAMDFMDKILKNMKTHVVQVVFQKLDGTTRTMNVKYSRKLMADRKGTRPEMVRQIRATNRARDNLLVCELLPNGKYQFRTIPLRNVESVKVLGKDDKAKKDDRKDNDKEEEEGEKKEEGEEDGKDNKKMKGKHISESAVVNDQDSQPALPVEIRRDIRTLTADQVADQILSIFGTTISLFVAPRVAVDRDGSPQLFMSAVRKLTVPVEVAYYPGDPTYKIPDCFLARIYLHPKAEGYTGLDGVPLTRSFFVRLKWNKVSKKFVRYTSGFANKFDDILQNKQEICSLLQTTDIHNVKLISVWKNKDLK